MNDRHDPTFATLGHFWDELIQGRPADPGDLDPALAETVRRLHARDDAPGADPVFSARLLTDLEDQMATTHLDLSARIGSHTSRYGTMTPGDRRLPIPARLPAPASDHARLRRWLLQVAAALVIVTFAMSYLAFGPLRFGGENGQRGNIPAVVGSPIPAPTSAETTGVTAVLPAGALPGEIVGNAMIHYTISAGTASTWKSTCCRGVRFNAVVAGSLTVHGDGPMQLLRAGGGTWEEVSAGTEITLEPGAVLLSRLGQTSEVGNASDSPAELLDILLFEGAIAFSPAPRGWSLKSDDIREEPLTMPPGAVMMRLDLTTVPESATFSLPPGRILDLWVGREQGIWMWLEVLDELTLRNNGDEPLSFYLFTLEPAPAGTLAP